MSVVILDAMPTEYAIGSTINDRFKERGIETVSFTLKDKKILPCSSCGSCGFISPGKCVVKDDMQDILKALAKSNTIILLTPIRFGGYSSCLKKAADKLGLLVLPSYSIKDGHLVHPNRYGEKLLIGIGVSDGVSKEQEKSFKKLVEHNALNLQASYKAITMKSTDDIEVAVSAILNGLEEAPK